jgi:hypothetical protein
MSSREALSADHIILLVFFFGISNLYSTHTFFFLMRVSLYVNVLVLKVQRVKEAMTQIYQKLQVNIWQRI